MLLQKKIQNRQSQPYIFLLFIVAIIVLGIAISVLMKPVSDIYNWTHNETIVQQDDYQEFFTRSRTLWIWLPVILAIGLVIWAFIKAHQKNQMEL